MVLSRFAVIRNRCMLDAKIRVIQFYNNFQRETDYDYRTRTRYATSLNADWNRGLVAMLGESVKLAYRTRNEHGVKCL